MKVIKNKNKKFWSFKALDENTGELILYGEMSSSTWWGDEVTPKQFKEDLDALGDIETLNVYINSPGGDVFAGQTIYSMLKRHKAQVNVYVDGVAASIASLIAMAGDKIIMPANAMMMIHSPWTIAMGNAQDFRKLADDMDKIRDSMIVAYESRSALTSEEIAEIMDAETWLSAEECLEYGFADEIAEAKQIAASMDEKYFAVYRNIPDELKRPPDKEVNSSDKDLIKQKLLLELEL
ncbi:MAG: head maturation protease, ClpP-related [Candidatus Wallacebacter cryptica]